jgi:signal transduction histidine kinase
LFTVLACVHDERDLILLAALICALAVGAAVALYARGRRAIRTANDYARALADARDAAESANRAKSEFLANMSHELRTPLNGVLGIAEALARTDLDRRQAQMLDIIRDSGGALEALLGDLLDLARAETGDIELDPRPVAVAELCGSVAALFATRAADKQLKLEVRVDAAAEVQVLADPLRLRQILTNLVGNAVKFTHNGGVTLSASLRDGPSVPALPPGRRVGDAGAWRGRAWPTALPAAGGADGRRTRLRLHAWHRLDLHLRSPVPDCRGRR